MSPALKHGDRVLVLRRFRLGWIRKGQIVLFLQDPLAQKHPSSLTTFHIKRVIALAGETFLSSATPLWENEHVLCQQSGDAQEVVYIWQIPHKHIFVCGDHREESLDSRKWGTLPIQNVHGIVLMKLPRKLDYQSLESPIQMPE
jgi:signal peptidase I